MARCCTECGDSLGGQYAALASSFVVLTDDLLASAAHLLPSASAPGTGHYHGLAAALKQQRALAQLQATPTAPRVRTCAGCFSQLSGGAAAEAQQLARRAVAYEGALRRLSVQSDGSSSSARGADAEAAKAVSVNAATPQTPGLRAEQLEQQQLDQQQQQQWQQQWQQWQQLEQQAHAARSELAQLDVGGAHLAALELAMAAAERAHNDAELAFEAQTAADRASFRARLAACDAAAAACDAVPPGPLAALFAVRLGTASADFEPPDGGRSPRSPTQGTGSAVFVNGLPLALVRQRRRHSSCSSSARAALASDAAAGWHEVGTLVACARGAAGLPRWPLPFGPHAACRPRGGLPSEFAGPPPPLPPVAGAGSSPVAAHGDDDAANDGADEAADEATDAAVLAVAVAVAATRDDLRAIRRAATATITASSSTAASATEKTAAVVNAAAAPSASSPFERLLREAAHLPVPLPAGRWPGLRWALGEALAELVALGGSCDGAAAGAAHNNGSALGLRGYTLPYDA
jgi:hypothetical protein